MQKALIDSYGTVRVNESERREKNVRAHNTEELDDSRMS